MPRYAAFLRAINVGGRTVRMNALRSIVESVGVDGVETFIASGNVIFETGETDAPALEARIEAGLRNALGWESTTFVRTLPQLATLIRHAPFAEARLREGMSLHIAFLRNAPSPALRRALMALRSGVDDFHVQGREAWWLVTGTMSGSTFSGAILEKTLQTPATMRNLRTVERIVARFGGE